MNAWEVDTTYADMSSQKVFGTPSGLSPVSFSPRSKYVCQSIDPNRWRTGFFAVTKANRRETRGIKNA